MQWGGDKAGHGVGGKARHRGGDKARQGVGGKVIHAGLRQGMTGVRRQSNAWGGGKARHGGKQGKA